MTPSRTNHVSLSGIFPCPFSLTTHLSCTTRAKLGTEQVIYKEIAEYKKSFLNTKTKHQCISLVPHAKHGPYPAPCARTPHSTRFSKPLTTDISLDKNEVLIKNVAIGIPAPLKRRRQTQFHATRLPVVDVNVLHFRIVEAVPVQLVRGAAYKRGETIFGVLPLHLQIKRHGR